MIYRHSHDSNMTLKPLGKKPAWLAQAYQPIQALLGWQPKQPGLIPDIDRPSYFEA